MQDGRSWFLLITLLLLKTENPQHAQNQWSSVCIYN